MIDPEEIWVDNRQRQQPHDDIPGLAKSMLDIGQLQPAIVIETGEGDSPEHEYKLIAGYGRYLAAILAQIPLECILKTDLTEVDLFKMELHEDIFRTERHWSDRVSSERDLFSLMNAEAEGTLTQAEFAKVIGKDQSTVSDDLSIAEILDQVPDIGNLESKKKAMQFVKSQIHEAAINEKRRRLVESEKARVEKATAPTEDGVVSGGSTLREYEEHRVTMLDAREAISAWKDGTFDLIVTDTPFGIELIDIKRREDAEAAGIDKTLYGEDTAEEYMEVMSAMIPEFYRVMKAESHLWLFFGINFLGFLIEKLEAAGFVVDPIPLIWYKTNFGGQSMVPEFNAGRVYEAFLFARKGLMHLERQGQPNVIACPVVPNAEKSHPTEKPELLLHEIISRSASPGMRIYDPFCGAGSTLAAAKKLSLDYWGNDREPLFREVTVRKLIQASAEMGGA